MPKLQKKHRTKKVKLHTQGYWKRQLDPLMSKFIREKGYCERCGRSNVSLDDAHIIGRINLTLRWDILNHLCLCFQCHKFFWHEEPLQASEWFKNKFPGRYEYLLKAKNITLKRTEEDYLKLKLNITNKNFDSLHLPLELLQIT